MPSTVLGAGGLLAIIITPFVSGKDTEDKILATFLGLVSGDRI